MTRAELLALLHNPESSGVEFKRDTVDGRALAKEIVAFANFQGGVLLLGVEDDGSVVGITRPDLEEWVMTVCRDKVRPEIIPYFEIVRDVESGRHVAVIRVEPGYTVHSLLHNHHRTYYIRIGSVAREASAEELERLFQRRGDFRVELRPVSGTSLDDLDLRRLRDYFEDVRDQAAPRADDRDAWEQLLLNTEILTDVAGRLSVTVAGLLLFGKNVNRYLPQAGIDAAAFSSTEKDYAATERASLRGPLAPLGPVREPFEPGLVEQAMSFVRRNTGVTAELVGGARRVERPVFPDDVIREAVVNALVHRDYMLSSSDVELVVYSDRLEIVSPGRLPNGITPERMRVGCRAARNQLLKDVMRDYGYLEHMGMGVPRKIIKGMKAHNGTEPDLIEYEESFTVRLWR